MLLITRVQMLLVQHYPSHIYPWTFFIGMARSVFLGLRGSGCGISTKTALGCRSAWEPWSPGWSPEAQEPRSPGGLEITYEFWEVPRCPGAVPTRCDVSANPA